MKNDPTFSRAAVETLFDLSFTVINGQPGMLSESGFLPFTPETTPRIASIYGQFFTAVADGKAEIAPHEVIHIGGQFINIVNALGGVFGEIKAPD